MSTYNQLLLICAHLFGTKPSGGKGMVESPLLWLIFGLIIAAIAIMLATGSAPELIKFASTFSSGVTDRIVSSG